jgi:hypothetical protein
VKDPCHPNGRLVEEKVIREMLNAVGVTICPRCHRAVTMRVPHARRVRE